MGITRPAIKLLMREGKREEFFGDILTAGRLDIYATLEDLVKWAKEMKFNLRSIEKAFTSEKDEFKRKGFITDRTFFQSIGFNNVDSIDCNDYEQCSIVYDLNTDIPKGLYNKYDLILDSGTSEHIFNLPKVLENYFKMLKVGGRIIHILPASNHIDHGFYMFSPTLFYDYYSANNWKIIDSLFIKSNSKHERQPWDIYKYEPGKLDVLACGGFRKGIYLSFIVACKKISSTFDAAVQQGYYLRNWETSSGETIARGKQLARMLPEFIKKFAFYQIAPRIPLKYYLRHIARY